jgi:hypothetical protein
MVWSKEVLLHTPIKVMKINNTLIKIPLLTGLIFLLASGLAACQANNTAEQPPQPANTNAAQAQPPVQQTSAQQSTAQQAPEGSTQPAPAAPTAAPENAKPDPAAIEEAWRSSPHANTFILDENGENNTCARCHAPVNWQPSMDDLPQSCYTCKFTLEDPPALIPESEWGSIPCKVCHKLDKKGNVQPEIMWLEIAPLDEYIAVASPSELCLKCHAPAEIPGHGIIDLANAHADYQCTGCHSAHSTTATCANAGCHSDVLDPAKSIPGHDADHQTVACVACHDGGGMQVGIDENTGLLTTFFTAATAEGASQNFHFASHNIVLQASCERCHYAGNPWNLSESVEQP